MCAQRRDARLQSSPGEGDSDHPVPRKFLSVAAAGWVRARHRAGAAATARSSPPQVVFPEKHWLPQDKLPQLEALLPPRQKVRVTDDMDQVELKEFNPGEQNWRQQREAYEEDDDGPRAGVQCQTA